MRRGQTRPPAQHLRLAGRRARQRRRHRPRGSAVQEHTQGLLPQHQQPAPQERRRRGRGSQSRTRHRRRHAHGTARQAAGQKGKPQVGRRHQAHLPAGQTGRHGQVLRGQKPRARHHDPKPTDSQRPRTADENRRQGHLLLHCRRARGLPTAHQGPCSHLPRAHRDETNRCPTGSRTHRRHGALRTRALLCYVDEELRQRLHRSSTLSGHLAQSAEARRHVCQAEVLS